MIETNPLVKRLKLMVDRMLFRHQTRWSSYLYQLRFQAVNLRFVSLLEYIHLTNEWAQTLPRGFDIVVGRPRTGVLTACIIGAVMGIPATDLNSFLHDDWLSPTNYDKSKKIINILLVDEQIGTGKHINEAKEKLLAKNPNYIIKMAVSFVRKAAVEKVDYYQIPFSDRLGPYLETFLSDEPLGRLCVDFDGVLCEDTPAGMTEQEAGQFYANARPKLIPTFEINCIVTGRREQYREVSEEWLRQNHVRYRELVMLKDNQEIIEIKAKAIMEHKPYWFWESSSYQSKILLLKTGCRVLCFENMYLYGGR